MADDDKKEQVVKNQGQVRKEVARELALRKQIIEEENNLIEVLEAKNSLRDEAINNHQKILRDIAEELSIAKEIKNFDQEKLAALQQEFKERKKIIKDLLVEKQALEDIKSTTAGYLQSLTGINNKTNTLIGGMLKLGDTNAGFATMGAEIKKTFTPINMLDNGLARIQEATMTLAMAQDTALASFNRTTGAMGKYNKMIINMEATNRLFGISTEDAANATAALFSQMNDFTQLSDVQQQKLATTVSVLEKFGVSADTTAKNMTIASRALGMNVDELDRLQRQLFATAEALNLPPQVVADGFSQAAPVLAKHGKNMVSVFQGLAEQSKKTGLAMDELLGIADKFDTFAGAAEAAGTLNTILGGDLLNSMDLLMATEEERIKMLQDSVTATGRSWHSMNRWEKKAIASAAGISDMNKAAMLFNPNMVGMSESAKRSATAMKNFEKNMKEVRPLLDELKSLAAEFAVEIRPAVVMLKDFVHWILELNRSFKKFMKENMPWEDAGNTGFLPWVIGGVLGLAVIGKLRGGLGLVAGGIKALSSPLAKLTKGASAAGGAIEGITKFKHGPPGKGLTEMGQGMNNAGKAAASSWKSILAFGGAVLLIGAGIGVAAWGLSKFVEAFNGMSPEQIREITYAIAVFMGSMVAMVAILAFVAPLAGSAGVALMPLGAAILMIGVGIGLAAFGMSLFATAMASAFTVISGNMEAFMAFVGGLMMISLMAVPLAAAFGSLTLGLGAMALALKFISTEDLAALGNLFMGISNITSDTISNLQAIAGEIKNIGEQLNNIDKEVLVNFGTLVNPPDVGVSTEQVVSRIRAVSAAVSVPAAVPAAATNNTATDNKPVENTFNITLEMDGDVLAKKVVKVVNGTIKGTTPSYGK